MSTHFWGRQSTPYLEVRRGASMRVGSGVGQRRGRTGNQVKLLGWVRRSVARRGVGQQHMALAVHMLSTTRRQVSPEPTLYVFLQPTGMQSVSHYS